MPISTNDHGIQTAVRCLLENFPESMWGRWLAVHQVHSQLQRGGFPNLPSDVVSRSFKGTHLTVRSDKYGSKRYYLFGDAKSLERAPKSYRDQVLLEQNNNKECRLSQNYYLHQRRLQGPLKDRIALLIEAGYAATAPNCSTSITPAKDKENATTNKSSAPVEKAPAVAESRDVEEPNDE
jgi:hypothetical protein